MFFGCPHRTLDTHQDIEILATRLDVLKPADSTATSLNMKCLARSIIDVNNSFLNTRVLTRANVINIISSKTDPAEKVSWKVDFMLHWWYWLAYRSLTNTRQHLEFPWRRFHSLTCLITSWTRNLKVMLRTKAFKPREFHLVIQQAVKPLPEETCWHKLQFPGRTISYLALWKP